MDELNAAALDHFIYTPVSRSMISYLANAACSVIQCDPTMMPPPPTAAPHNSRLPPTPPKTPPPRAVPAEDAGLPTLEEFITQLVVSSNVQVPTLMSTLVYLNRLRSRLQPMAKGLRCTTHRIFLASLILAAKYLNDSSPKNKHWANYSVMPCAGLSFGFSRTEVNLMEKQLLFLLDWDLRITEEDLYRELDLFLAPLRDDLAARHERRQRRKAAQQAAQAAEEERRRVEEEEAAAAAAWLAAQTATRSIYTTPPATPDSRSRCSSRQESPDSLPGLSSSSYGSRSIHSSHSYASSLSSRGSEATTPLSSYGEAPYIYDGTLHTGSLYEAPVEIVLEQPKQQQMLNRPAPALTKQRSLLPYEISAEELRDLQEGGSRVKRMRGMLGRVFGGSSATAR
jgi:PHO85 cyclin-1